MPRALQHHEREQRTAAHDRDPENGGQRAARPREQIAEPRRDQKRGPDRADDDAGAKGVTESGATPPNGLIPVLTLAASKLHLTPLDF